MYVLLLICIQGRLSACIICIYIITLTHTRSFFTVDHTINIIISACVCVCACVCTCVFVCTCVCVCVYCYQDSEEEEVMPLDLSSSEADLSSTDQSGYERDPLSLKAWGRKVATYYEEGEGESLDSELEEREALQLQTLQAGLLSPSDFDVPFPGIDQSPLNSVSRLILNTLCT